METQNDLHDFVKLFQDNQQAFVRFAYSYVRDMNAAEDIVMDAMVDCWEGRHHIRWEIEPLPYFFTSIKNKALNWLRHALSVQENSSLMQEQAVWELSNRIATLEACDPVELFSADIQNIIDDTLAHMSRDTRRIFELSRYEGKSYKEIACVMGISVKTVEFHLSKALKELRVALKDYWGLLPFILAFSFLFEEGKNCF